MFVMPIVDVASLPFLIINRRLVGNEQVRDHRLPNRTIPRRYLLINQGESIGEGTFGKVRMGVHIHTAQKVAIKTLQK